MVEPPTDLNPPPDSSDGGFTRVQAPCWGWGARAAGTMVPGDRPRCTGCRTRTAHPLWFGSPDAAPWDLDPYCPDCARARHQGCPCLTPLPPPAGQLQLQVE